MKYTFNNVSEDRFLEGKKKITSNGGSLYTDGSFEISGVEGSYRYEDGLLEITITDKPWLASWDMIGSKLKGFFG